MFDDNYKYFGLSLIPYFNFDLPRILNSGSNLELPISIGFGCVSSWDLGINYWNPSIMFEVKYAISDNKDQDISD